jgi:hypothetical protein
MFQGATQSLCFVIYPTIVDQSISIGVHKDKYSYMLLGQCSYILLGSLSLSLSPPRKHNMGECYPGLKTFI